MKNYWLPILGAALLVVVAAPLQLQAVEAPDAIVYHQSLAASYEQKALAQDALIAEHVQMKKDYTERFATNPKMAPPADIQKMNSHCDTIIKEAETLKQDFLDFAKWHKMRASELQGQ